MNIKIQGLSLNNFKCFKGFNMFDFDGKQIITVKGRNGAGKTTIADAILWCLFGKNSQGQSDFDLKTHGEDGKPIPHLDHSVELLLSIDGKEVSLKRTIKETWIKKRGADEQVFKNNTTEYMVNGDAYTAADYKKYIASLISEDVFRAITNPTYFPSLKWQEQRKFLELIADDVKQPDGEEFADLLKQLNDSDEDIIAHRKHLSYQIKEIKKKLDLIPTRLEEQHKALPEKVDSDNINSDLLAKKNQIEEIEKNILSIKTGSGADVKRDELRKEIDSKQAILVGFKKQAMVEQSTYEAAHNKKVSDLALKFNNELNNQKLMEQTIEADKRLIERCKEVDYEAELQKLRDQWPTSKFVVDPNLSYCPTCGQPIPQEQYQEKVEEMRKNFNLQREAKIKELNEKAAKIKQQQADAGVELHSLESKLADDTKQLEKIKEAINNIFAEKSKAEKVPVPTQEEILSSNVEYVDLSKQVLELEDNLANITDSDEDKDRLTELEGNLFTLKAEVENLQQQLASVKQYERGISLIEAIQAEEKGLIAQLSELERLDDIARRYQERQNEILEECINKHFNLVRWKMFRTVNNGGDPFDEPFCECYVDGVAYHDGLNQAARLNAGLDIINTLSKYYQVSAPICLDNAESTINIIETLGQQIRFVVSDCDLQLW